MKYSSVANNEFEQWFRKYWGGISLAWESDAEEYCDKAAQAAWEVWQRFWPEKEPCDTKLWSVTVAARYRRGSLIEHFDHSLMSSCHPIMIEYPDYAVMFKVIEHYEKEVQDLCEKLKKAKVPGYYREGEE